MTAGAQPHSQDGVISSPGLISELVNQFEDPLAFYRELIQNSLDAKSNRIDVTLDYHQGAAAIRIEDDGEGMNEHIIDTYLVVKFRSDKDGDFTKIGKFGIGFLSIFALDPDIVRVYTSRGGESWRIDFHGHQRYEKYRLAKPRDGTMVELIKTMREDEYDELVRRSRQTVQYWCKYADARIYFSSRDSGNARASLREAFDLPGGAVLRHVEEGTEIVLGFSPQSDPFYGLYSSR